MRRYKKQIKGQGCSNLNEQGGSPVIFLPEGKNMKINRNMLAVSTNRQLLRTENKLTASMERLSSGYKINKAGDNPAGIAISSKMRAQIAGLDQAESNASDGESVLNIADGALNEVSNILQRIRELAVQAANDTNSYNDRESMQEEIEALTKEVDRISTDTEYNSKTLLDGSCNTRSYSDQAERLDISDKVLVGTYSLDVTQAAEQASCEINSLKSVSANTEGTITINGVSMDYTKEMTESFKATPSDDNDFFRELTATAEEAGCVATRTIDDNTKEVIGYKITSKDYGDDEMVSLEISGKLGEELVPVSASGNAARKLTVDASSAYSREPDSNGEAQVEFSFEDIKTNSITGTITINGVDLTLSDEKDPEELFKKLSETAEKAGCSVLGSATSTSYTLISSEDISLEFSNNIATTAKLSVTEDDRNKINYSIDAVGQDAKIEIDDTSAFYSTASYTADGKRIKITDLNGFSMDFQLTDNSNTEAAQAAAAKQSYRVNIEVTDIGAMTLQVGANQYQEIDVRIPEISSESLYLDTVNVAVAGGADKALDTIDEAISKLGDVRSGIGAYTNRLEYAVSSLSETQIDLTSALSNIMDTDMAEEMTEYTQQNVLEQAAISVLSQANDLPQQVLSLLQ
jgi:flagellin